MYSYFFCGTPTFDQPARMEGEASRKHRGFSARWQGELESRYSIRTDG